MKTYRLYNTISILILFSILSFWTIGCSSTDPEVKEESSLTVTDVSCTEVWLELKAGNIALPSTGVIRINGTNDKPVTISAKDTVLYIDSLEVNRHYKFQVILLNQGQTLISNEVTTKTLDTTSHNFIWQTFELGEHSHNVLFDVAIIDENNIWAVGEIYLKDSLGNDDDKRYNAIHFDGTKWEVLRIPYDYYGTLFYHPIQSIYAFNPNEVWFCGNGVIMWNGSDFIPKEIPSNVWGSYLINKIWGTSSSDLYIVGDGGNIAHYNGSSWTKIESGTNVELKSITSSPDGKTMWACGSSGDYSSSVFLEKTGNDWKKVFEGSPSVEINNSFVGVIQSVWTKSNGNVYLGSSSGLFRHNKNEELKLQKVFSPSDYPFSYKGEEKNNIWVCGQNGLVGHYNGNSYYELTGIKKMRDKYYGIDINGKTTCVVGIKYENIVDSKAIIQIIKQQ